MHATIQKLRSKLQNVITQSCFEEEEKEEEQEGQQSANYFTHMVYFLSI